MTDLDLGAIKRRAEAAKPAPWTSGGRFHPHEVCIAMNRPLLELDDVEDAVFIAAARTDVPTLVAEVERLQRLLGADPYPTSDAFESLNQAYVDMRGLVIEILRYFYDLGQPGQSSYRSNWVPADTLARWRRIAEGGGTDG